MIKDDGHVLHFTTPKGIYLLVVIGLSHTSLLQSVQASLSANTFAISGNYEEKRKPHTNNDDIMCIKIILQH